MRQTSRPITETFMEHIDRGEIPATISVVDKDGVRGAWTCSMRPLHPETLDQISSLAMAVLTLREAHRQACKEGLKPLY